MEDGRRRRGWGGDRSFRRYLMYQSSAMPRLSLPLRLAVLLGAVQAAAGPARAQGVTPEPRSAERGATVRGTVHDSLAGRPLVDAMVQLVTRDPARPFGATATTDSAGAFAFDSVPAGAYAIGFFHPLLDSLGVEPPLRPLDVRGAGVVRTTLAVPSAATLHASICGPSPHPEQGVLVVGFMRRAATDAPVDGATVRGEWMELTLGGGGMRRTSAGRTATTSASGWFALCQLPARGTVVLQGLAGADSTDRTELEMVPGVVVRQPLLVPEPGAAGVLLAGVVRAMRDARPLANALVSVGGRSTRTDDAGRWRIADAPAGTRTVEVRAVGYFPVRQLAQVVAGAPPLVTTLATLRSVLDTVKVLANYNRYSLLQEFSQRARGGMGRFLTAQQIAQRVPLVTSDLFTAVPGVYLQQDSLGPVLTMKGIFADRCIPTVFIDGVNMGATSLTDIDMLVKPERLLGVEIYSAGLVPAQFEPGMSGCGSLVFWTR